MPSGYLERLVDKALPLPGERRLLPSVMRFIAAVAAITVAAGGSW